jgi:hypothetical protein
MNTTPSRAPRARTLLLGLGILAIGSLFGGCQQSKYATFAGDIRNGTPQPLYVQLLERHPDTGGVAGRAATRLGPGDRASIGPSRMRIGYAMMQVDTKPNPEAPISIDLEPGTTILEVTQRTDEVAGPLQVRRIDR